MAINGIKVTNVGSTVRLSMEVDTFEEAQALITVINALNNFAEVSDTQAIANFFGTGD